MREYKKRSRGDKRSKIDEIKITEKIHDLLPKYDDQKIMYMLRIPNQTYYRLKSKILEEAREIWRTICTESLEYRALEVKNTLDYCYRVSESIAIDPKQRAQVRLEACANMFELQMDHLKLLIEGPQYLKEQYPIPIRQEEQKPYVETYDWREKAKKVRRNSK